MCHLPPQGISYTLKMEAGSSLKCLYLSTHNLEDRGHQTHHPEGLKYRKQSKEQNRWCIRMKSPCHRTTPCWLSLTACSLRSQKNENCLTPIGYGTTNSRIPFNLNYEDGFFF